MAASLLRGVAVMNRAMEIRLAKLETAAPSAPSGFDAFTADELMVQLLEGYSEVLARGDLPAAELQEVRNWRQAIVDDISMTIELRTGARPYPVPRASYAATVAEAADRWAAAGGKSAYVPTLNHGDTGSGEYDGFDGSGPLVPHLMERRYVLWGDRAVLDLISRCQPQRIARVRREDVSK
jgi:hypothetical protein